MNTEELKVKAASLIQLLYEYRLLDKAKSMIIAKAYLNAISENKLNDILIWKELAKHMDSLTITDTSWYDTKIYESFLTKKLASKVEIETVDKDTSSLNIEYKNEVKNYKIDDHVCVDSTKKPLTNNGINIINAFLKDIRNINRIYPMYNNTDGFNVTIFAEDDVAYFTAKQTRKIFDYPVPNINLPVTITSLTKSAFCSAFDDETESWANSYNYLYPQKDIDAELEKHENIDLANEGSVIMKASGGCTSLAMRYNLAENSERAKFYWTTALDLDNKVSDVVKKHFNEFYDLRATLINCYLGNRVAALQSLKSSICSGADHNTITLANIYYYCGQVEKAKEMYNEIYTTAENTLTAGNKDWTRSRLQNILTCLEISIYLGDIKNAKHFIDQVAELNHRKMKSVGLLTTLYEFVNLQAPKKNLLVKLHAILKDEINNMYNDEWTYDTKGYINIIKASQDNSVNLKDNFIHGIDLPEILTIE